MANIDALAFKACPDGDNGDGRLELSVAGYLSHK